VSPNLRNLVGIFSKVFSAACLVATVSSFILATAGKAKEITLYLLLTRRDRAVVELFEG